MIPKFRGWQEGDLLREPPFLMLRRWVAMPTNDSNTLQASFQQQPRAVSKSACSTPDCSNFSHYISNIIDNMCIIQAIGKQAITCDPTGWTEPIRRSGGRSKRESSMERR